MEQPDRERHCLEAASRKKLAAPPRRGAASFFALGLPPPRTLVGDESTNKIARL